MLLMKTIFNSLISFRMESSAYQGSLTPPANMKPSAQSSTTWNNTINFWSPHSNATQQIPKKNAKCSTSMKEKAISKQTIEIMYQWSASAHCRGWSLRAIVSRFLEPQLMWRPCTLWPQSWETPTATPSTGTTWGPKKTLAGKEWRMRLGTSQSTTYLMWHIGPTYKMWMYINVWMRY